MARQIPFTKMHGLGNDYVYVNAIENPLDNPEGLSVIWSDRHKGIGSDGLIMICSSEIADFRMRMFNNDGSEGMMCGNGARCVARFLHDKKLTDKTEIRLETLAGIKILKLHLTDQDEVESVTVDMGQGLPELVCRENGEKTELIRETVTVNGNSYTGTAINMGNPHLVLLVDDAEKAPVAEDGSLLEVNSMFPNKVNVEFAQVIDRTHVRMRVWERGSGITQACGTGACATAVALAMAGLTDSKGCEIRMDGGALTVSWDPETRTVLMTGTATTVFEGTIEIPE
ncbi:MAG: diaminopimelate epimerase [Bacteroidaceae bacterium]|nr:diaminopimelate epimerase [Bacteroidaceae bacterium]